MKKIGILTGGADCPGMNSVIRAVVRKSVQEGCVVTGIKNGWNGLVNNDMRVLDLRMTSGILDRGGTILGTSRMVSPLPTETMSAIYENYRRSGIDALVAVGGEDTLKIALDLYVQFQLPIVGVPKSIDNELSGTDYAFGFDTAVNIATECIDRLHTTAESHHRIIVIEVMGRHTGWIAVQAGIAGGANFMLVPEFPVDIDKLCNALQERNRRGKMYSIIVVSEGAQIKGHFNPRAESPDDHHSRSPKIGETIAKLIELKTGCETRVSVLGHIQRGGTPTAQDRLIGTRFGVKSVELILAKQFGKMVSLKGNKIQCVDMSLAVSRRKTIDKDLYYIATAFSDI
ncbi:MAG: 6-phosphofructokinase [Candidatus Omnitrophica bacterium]|nr:6-phosphofructokinase [Candidatus Omnitrophota bacterium]